MNKLFELFELRGALTNTQQKIIEIVGFILLIILWFFATNFIPKTLLPSPWNVLCAFKELHYDDALVLNAFYSIKLNVLGYIEAVLISLPLGFVIGLFPVFNSMFRRYLDVLRFIPLTAVTGLFIVWFGIETNMKVQFLAFGIMVYLIPTVVQRVSETNDIYVQTALTLGANKWQIIKTVFIPDVLSKVSADVRIVLALSWTYIIVAELVNKSDGIGSLAFTAARQSRIDKVFAILVVIALIGFIQDKFFMFLDKKLFPFKY